ncbi:MAG: hypothetical protein ACLR4Z_14935 [Butyricicoccaceae bacterium]
MPVCYNGDLVASAAYGKRSNAIRRFPRSCSVAACSVTLLVTRVRGGERAGSARLQAFHDTLFARYCEAFGDSRIAVRSA